jgi:hypothetical protein
MIFAVPPRSPRCSIVIAPGLISLAETIGRLPHSTSAGESCGIHAEYDAIDALTVARF